MKLYVLGETAHKQPSRGVFNWLKGIEYCFTFIMCSSHFLVLLGSWCPGGNTVVGGVDTKIKEMEPPRKENKLELQRSHDWNNHHQIMVDSFIYSENIECVPTTLHRIIWIKPDQKKPMLLRTKKRSNWPSEMEPVEWW